MTPELWKQIEQLYQSAVDTNEGVRAELLAAADPEVRRTVERMLAEASVNNLLDQPAWESLGTIPSAEPAILAAGYQLGPYRIQDVIGRGGMGAVYRAFDSRLNRQVAIKILPPDLAADSKRLQRFEQEARAVGSLNHPNILTIFDVGTIENTSYLVSELLEGQTLRDRLRSSALPRDKAVAYGRLLAAGLAAAHEHGIVHRDLKPENIFLTRDGRLKILDFGLAKFSAPHARMGELAQAAKLELPSAISHPGVLLGTIGYMSPEQVEGRQVDHRSDLFSLGVVLYEMLTGRRAFAGANFIETLHAILNDQPDFEALDGHVEQGLVLILRHCLEKDPGERFQTAKDVAFGLTAVEGLTAKPAKDRLTVIRWMTAAAGLCVAAAVLFFVGRGLGKGKPQAQARFRQITFRSGNITGGRFTHDNDGQTIVYSAAWEGGQIATYTARADSSESRLLLPSAGVLALSARGELALMLGCELNWGGCRGTLARMPIAGGAPREILQDSDSADWDPQGNLAVIRPYQGRFRLEFPIGNVLYENATGWISDLRFSPKGDRIAFINHPRIGNNDGSVEVLDLHGKRTILASNRQGLKGMAWVPSGDELWFSASASRSPILSGVTMSGKERVVLQTPGWSEIMDIAPDGRALLVRQNPRTSMMFRASEESADRNLSWFDWSTSADLSSDGKTLLFYEWGEGVGGVPVVYLRNTAGGDAVRLGEGKALALSPDKKWVLALKHSSPPQLILLPTGPGESRLLPNSGVEDYYSGTWFPDSKRVLFSGETSDHVPRTFSQDIDGGEAHATVEDGVRASLVSPDGKKFAAYGPDGDYYLIPAAGGKRVPLRGTHFGDELIQWSSDGNYIFVRERNENEIALYRIDLGSGGRLLWKTLAIPDRVGFIAIEEAPGSIRITPDGKYFAYTFWQARGEIYIATGLN